MPTESTPADRRQPAPVALQLYSLHAETKRDFAATVLQVASLGYEAVELAGYGNLDAAAAAAALQKAGLKVSGLHVGLDRLQHDLIGVVDEALRLDARHVICPHWPERQFGSREACSRIGKELARLGEFLAAFGLRFSYHPHAAEFRLIDGRPVFAWILDAAAPAFLAAELDVYWATVAGYPPERFLREQGNRVPLIHCKDETELGQGPVDFSAVFGAAGAIAAVEWYVVEQEKYSGPALPALGANLRRLRAWTG